MAATSCVDRGSQNGPPVVITLYNGAVAKFQFAKYIAKYDYAPSTFLGGRYSLSRVQQQKLFEAP